MLPLGSERLVEQVIGGLQGRRAKGSARSPIDHELEIDVVVGQVHQIVRHEHWLKLAREDVRVVSADTERDERADIAEHGMPNRRSSWKRC